MSRSISLVALAIVAVFTSSDRMLLAAASTTQPYPAVSKAILKSLGAKDQLKNDQMPGHLNAKNREAELWAQMQQLEQAFRPHKEATLRIPDYKIPPINPAPSSFLLDPGSILGSFNYNGRTVYLVGPLIAKPLTLSARRPVDPQPARPELIGR